MENSFFFFALQVRSGTDNNAAGSWQLPDVKVLFPATLPNTKKKTHW